MAGQVYNDNRVAFDARALIDEYFKNVKKESLRASFRQGGFFYSSYGGRGRVCFAAALLFCGLAIVAWFLSLQGSISLPFAILACVMAVVAIVFAYRLEKSYDYEGNRKWRVRQIRQKHETAESLLSKYGVESTEQLSVAMKAVKVELERCASETDRHLSYADTIFGGIGGVFFGAAATALTPSGCDALVRILVAAIIVAPLWAIFHVFRQFFPLLAESPRREDACRDLINYILLRLMGNFKNGDWVDEVTSMQVGQSVKGNKLSIKWEASLFESDYNSGAPIVRLNNSAFAKMKTRSGSWLRIEARDSAGKSTVIYRIGRGCGSHIKGLNEDTMMIDFDGVCQLGVMNLTDNNGARRRRVSADITRDGDVSSDGVPLAMPVYEANWVVSKASFFGCIRANLQHPDRGYRVSMQVAFVGLFVGVLGLTVGILGLLF